MILYDDGSSLREIRSPAYHGCILRKKPELIKQPRDKLFRTLKNEEGSVCVMVKCRECGRKYRYCRFRRKDKASKKIVTEIVCVPVPDPDDAHPVIIDTLRWRSGEKPAWETTHIYY